MSNSLILQELKQLILVKNKLKNPSPSDCRLISVNIYKELKKNVSETTLKRLFGFATIKHQFSQFTINTLTEYVGLESDRYLSLQRLSLAKTGHDLEEIRQEAERITQHTLLNVKNRCSVPYEMTVPRKFARYDLELFRQSKFSYTSFVSQPGYGKSILVSHLVQDMFLSETAPFKNDIVLWLNASYIFNKELSEFTLEERIKLKLGIHQKTNLITYFDERHKSSGIKFFLIIDGISDLIVSQTDKPKMFERMIDLIAGIEDCEHVKLIFNMRSTTWNRFYETVRHSYFLKNKWFPGSYYNVKDTSNVPPLTENEVEEIFNKMSPMEYSKISENLKAQLRFPFHIQWYYQLKEEYPNFESYTNIIFYEIIARFIKEKIYNSNHATEKVLFCKKVIYLTKYGRKTDEVLKTDLIREMPGFEDAYLELLADGILMEEKKNEDGFSTEYVRFIQPHIFEYFLFVELYDLFGHIMDDKFFQTINTEYVGNQSRFQLLQWSARLLVRLKKFKELNSFLALPLSNYEKNYLIYFIAENLNYRHKIDPTIAVEIKAQGLHQIFIRHLIHFDFVDSCYKEAISCLIEVADNKQTALFYHTTLAMFECLSLNEAELLKSLNKMKALEEVAFGWVINPVATIRLIYAKIWGDGEPNEVLKTIEAFKTGDTLTDCKELPNHIEALSYLLMFVVNIFFGNQLEAINITTAVLTRHPKLMRRRNAFSIYLLNLMALANARVNPGKKAQQMETILTNLCEDTSRCQATLYSRSFLLAVKSEQLKNNRKYDQALVLATDFLEIHERNELAIHQLVGYKLVASIYKEMNNFEKVIEYREKIYQLLATKNAKINVFN